MILLKRNTAQSLDKSSEIQTITVTLRDRDGSLKRLLGHVKSNSDGGHSFSVLVDPGGDVEQKKSFGIDGDGDFFIKEVK